MSNVMPKCKICGRPVLFQWKYCNDCDKPLPISKPSVDDKNISKKLFNYILEDYKANKIALERALNTVESYQQFFTYFTKELKPLQEKWNKRQKELSTDTF